MTWGMFLLSIFKYPVNLFHGYKRQMSDQGSADQAHVKGAILMGQGSLVQCNLAGEMCSFSQMSLSDGPGGSKSRRESKARSAIPCVFFLHGSLLFLVIPIVREIGMQDMLAK